MICEVFIIFDYSKKNCWAKQSETTYVTNFSWRTWEPSRCIHVHTCIVGTEWVKGNNRVHSLVTSSLATSPNSSIILCCICRHVLFSSCRTQELAWITQKSQFKCMHTLDGWTRYVWNTKTNYKPSQTASINSLTTMSNTHIFVMLAKDYIIRL